MMKTKIRKYLYSAVLIIGAALMMAACAVDRDNASGGSPTVNPADDPATDQLLVKVTADVPTAVLSQFDATSMGGALVRRLGQTTSEITPDTRMVLIKGEDILGRPLKEWLEAAKIYLRGGYVAIEKPHNAHLVNFMEQLADKMAQAEDELMLNNGISIVRPVVGNTATKSDVAARFKARIANIEARADRRAAGEKEAVAELVIFANNGYYSCAPAATNNVLVRITDKNGNVTTKEERVKVEPTMRESGLQADGAAQWLNTRDEAQQMRRASRRASGSDAINDLMSADEEHNYQAPLCGYVPPFSYPHRVNGFNEIFRTWGVHNMETKKDYYFIEQKIVASVGGKQEGDDRFNPAKTLYYGPYEKDKFYDDVSYGSWFSGGQYSMDLSGKGNVQLEDAKPSTDNNEGSTTVSVGTFEATTKTIGGTITPGYTQKTGASITGSGTFSTGYTQGNAFFMGSTVNYKELACKKNTDGTKVSWTYSCGSDMMEGDWDEHPLAPDVLTGDVDLDNQICWSVSNPEGNYNLTIEQNIPMNTLQSYEDPEEKRIIETIVDALENAEPLSFTLPVPNRSKQIWNMDVTFPEITQDGYNEVKPKLTAALQNQFPSVYQPELLLADQTPESENTIKQVVNISKNLLTDANALQTLREYALTYKISQFTIKWYCSGTTHNTFQLTVKAEGDPIVPGAEITRDPVDLSKLTADYVAQDGDVLTGTLGGNYQISLAPGAIVTLNGVTINGTNDENYKWAGITLTGNAILVLADGSKNVVKGFFEDAPGILIPPACTLIIQGNTGTLDASSNGGGCGIGCHHYLNGGNIEIQGGVITATGGVGCAGIGASPGHLCGNINISGGTVTAQGGPFASGIGSGRLANENDKSVCGTITISGGTVTATGGSDNDTADEGSAGIGSGYYGKAGDIILSGGTITAIARGDAYGIGAGHGGSCDNITITKGVTSVTVTGDIGGARGSVNIEEGANVIKK